MEEPLPLEEAEIALRRHRAKDHLQREPVCEPTGEQTEERHDPHGVRRGPGGRLHAADDESEVEPGSRDEAKLILAGLADGEQVIVEPSPDVVDGRRVEEGRLRELEVLSLVSVADRWTATISTANVASACGASDFELRHSGF